MYVSQYEILILKLIIYVTPYNKGRNFVFIEKIN